MLRVGYEVEQEKPFRVEFLELRNEREMGRKSLSLSEPGFLAKGKHGVFPAIRSTVRLVSGVIGDVLELFGNESDLRVAKVFDGLARDAVWPCCFSCCEITDQITDVFRVTVQWLTVLGCSGMIPRQNPFFVLGGSVQMLEMIVDFWSPKASIICLV